MNMMFSRSNRRTSMNESKKNLFVPIYYKIPSVAKPPEPSKPPPEVNKMKWGKPTWYFLHTLAEKVKPENFDKIKKELLNIIYSICCNLPCPTCASHAQAYLNKINFKNINSKDQLKNILYVFHNSLNKQKGYDLFAENELHSLYEKAQFVNITKNFLYYFSGKYTGSKLTVDDIQRSQIISNIKNWLNNNIHNFDL